MARASLEINGQKIAAGSRATIDLPLPKLNSHTDLSMSVHVIHGRQDGPRLFISAAVHGDEVNGVEIIRRVLEHKSIRQLRGSLLAVPVVNVYGLIHESRYLPDRRDLNRSFPGSEKGSLAGRVAHVFMQQVVAHCSHGIDLHTGAIHRSNLPQIRANLEHPETERLAQSFGVPVLLNSALRDGSLRQAADELGIPMLLYEAGEALRYDELSIRAGTQGILNVMRELGMLRKSTRRRAPVEPFVADSSSWVRAPESGMLRHAVALGARVKKGELLGHVSDPYSGHAEAIICPINGVVIGCVNLPIIHEGEALFHIARFSGGVGEVVDNVDNFHQHHSDDELYD